MGGTRPPRPLLALSLAPRSPLPFPLEADDHDSVWAPVADIMAGLMVIFMLLVAVLSTQIDPEISAEEAFVRAHRSLQGALSGEVAPYLADWNAEFDSSSLALRFADDQTLFRLGSAELSPSYRQTLDEVVPRLLAVLERDGVRPLVEEVRIEGHTSTEWNRRVSPRQAYLLNMELSQDRTRSVLAFVLSHPAVQASPHRAWLQRHLTANGLSSSRPIHAADGREDAGRSRRVEFRLQMRRDSSTVDLMRRRAAELREAARASHPGEGERGAGSLAPLAERRD